MDRFKREICGHFAVYLKDSGKDQIHFAKKLKIEPSLMSKVIRQKLEGFTLDRLLKYLKVIRPDLIPALKKTSKAKKNKRKNT